VIILSGVLVVLAIALLVTGIVTGNTGHEIAGLDGLKLIYVSIGVSIVSALFLAIGVFLRRKELFGLATTPATSKASAAGRAGRASRPAKAKARVGAGEEPSVPMASATATDVPAETTVYVVPGRKRYHLETCRQLAGRDKEELTFVEAHEEGFTACTACLPDTALAARAAIADTATGERPADSAAVPAESGTEPPPADTAPVTRTDLPIARREPAAVEPAAVEPAAVEPAAVEPAAVEPAPSEPAASEPAPAEAAEAPEVSEYTEADDPVARHGRSFFEPLTRADQVDAADTATADAMAADATAADTDRDENAAVIEPVEPAEAADSAPGGVEHAAPAHEADEPDHTAREDTALAEPPDPAHDEPFHDEPFHDEPFHDEPQDAATDTAEPAPAATDEPLETSSKTAEDDAPANDDVADTAGRPVTADEHGPGEEPAAAASAEDADQAADADDDGADEEPGTLSIVRILSGTKRYHRPDCALIEDIAEDADDLETLTPAEAKERGCTPCLVCQPDKDHPDLY
jgi:hypothetical protein